MERTTQALVSVSGGSDSLALALLLQRCWPIFLRQQTSIDLGFGQGWTALSDIIAAELANPIQPRVRSTGRIAAVIVDHSLRDESKSECRWTEEVLRCHGIPSTRLTITLPDSGGTTITRARVARSTAIGEFAVAQGFPVVFQGHHGDDQIETVILRATRSSGSRGLAAMYPVTPTWWGGREIRPLLNVQKSQLRAWLRYAAGLNSWIEDPSNMRPTQTRVRWRKLLNPATNQPAILPPEFAARTQRFATTQQLRWQKSNARHVKQWRACMTRTPEGCLELNRFRWQLLDDTAQQWLIYAVLRECGDRISPPAWPTVRRICHELQATNTPGITPGITLGGVWFTPAPKRNQRQPDAEPLNPIWCLRDHGACRPRIFEHLNEEMATGIWDRRWHWKLLQHPPEHAAVAPYRIEWGKHHSGGKTWAYAPEKIRRNLPEIVSACQETLPAVWSYLTPIHPLDKPLRN